MMDGSTLMMALLMGLTGSLHCAGMCGAIIWVMPFQLFGGAKKVLAVGLYHLARISVYAAMAVVLYTFRDMFNPRIQQVVSVVLGSILLLTGILTFLPRYTRLTINLPWTEYVKKQLGKVIGAPVLWKITLAGALNGLLPCGLVYMALSATLSLSSPAMAVGFVYVFGLGTLPLLMSITFLKSRIHLRVAHVQRFVPAVLFFFGCVFVMRGMNLGIPYLSPKVEVVNHEVIHSCCHKK